MADERVRKLAEEALNRFAAELEAGKGEGLRNYLGAMSHAPAMGQYLQNRLANAPSFRRGLCRHARPRRQRRDRCPQARLVSSAAFKPWACSIRSPPCPV